ncbi:MAG: protein kinase [Acidobacteria bacterium]|nr:protein kinase [Acidobacteriota bacterium]
MDKIDQLYTKPLDPALAPQRQVGAYLLLEKIGAGGLGEVWKARDPRLDRVVALKFILSEGRQSTKDLLREARTAAALNHPNVVTILEVGESGDGAYIAMEFVQGESLRQRMTRSRIPLDAAVDIVIQVARGLGAAHQHGTVHRDVKPENVMIRVDGYVKVVDFGVAKVLPWSDAGGAATAGSTETGQLAGTFNYMSPEQARGQKITSASDIFSLGIVFYELLTGEHPFKTDNTMDTLQRILSVEPVSTRTRCPELPDEAHEVVARCLEKDPAKRFASAGEIEERLHTRTAPAARSKTPRRWPTAVAALLIALVLFFSAWFFWPAPMTSFAAVRSIAVMNFRSVPNDAGAAQLAQGLPEDLGAALSNQGFLVASRSGVLALEEPVTTKRVAAELAVEGVVEGTVTMAGNNLRVHVELASGQTGFQIWNRTFAVDPQSLLDGGAGISVEIAEQIRNAVASGR